MEDQTVWLNAWLAVAGSGQCNSDHTPTAWADQCLAQFRKRFPQPEVGLLEFRGETEIPVAAEPSA